VVIVGGKCMAFLRGIKKRQKADHHHQWYGNQQGSWLYFGQPLLLAQVHRYESCSHPSSCLSLRPIQ
jgi:hypothetical protein